MFYNSAFSGKGGVAIIYKKSLMFSVKEITCYDTNGRIETQLDDHKSNVYYIIGAYLPSDVNVDT